MSINVVCPTCQKEQSVKEELAGSRIKCPTCGSQLTATKESALETSSSDKPTVAPDLPIAEPTKRRGLLGWLFGRSEQVTDGYGLSAQKPVLIGGASFDTANPAGALLSMEEGAGRKRDYLDQLRCPKGKAVRSNRTGSVMGTGPHAIDRFEIVCECGRHRTTVFLDAYNDGPEKPIGLSGWSLQKPSPADCARLVEEAVILRLLSLEGWACNQTSFDRAVAENMLQIDRLRNRYLLLTKRQRKQFTLRAMGRECMNRLKNKQQLTRHVISVLVAVGQAVEEIEEEPFAELVSAVAVTFGRTCHINLLEGYLQLKVTRDYYYEL